MAQQQFVAISITPEARERLRALGFALTGRLGRRVSLSGAIMAAVTVAESHPEEAADAISDPNGDDE